MKTMTADMMRRLGLKSASKPLTDAQIADKAARRAERILTADAKLPASIREFWAGSVSSSVLADVAAGKLQIDRA